MTTRRHNFRGLGWLGRREGTFPARTFRRSVLGFDHFVQAPLGLTSGCLPTADLTSAGGILAVTLVPTARLELLARALTQAKPLTRSAPTGTAVALHTRMMATHGSVVSQGTARGERANVLLGRFSTRTEKQQPCQSILHEVDGE